jgi:hypothetical protein
MLVNKNGAEAPFNFRVMVNHSPFSLSRPGMLQGGFDEPAIPTRALYFLSFPMQFASTEVMGEAYAIAERAEIGTNPKNAGNCIGKTPKSTKKAKKTALDANYSYCETSPERMARRTSPGTSWISSRSIRFARWASTVLTLTPSRSAISLVACPSATSCSTSF